MNNNVRKITDGAMMVALIGVYLVLNRETAYLFDGLLLFALPLPLVFYSTKYGFKNGLLPYVAMVFLAFILGGFTQVFYVASEGMCGLIYGNGIKKNVSSTTLLLRTMGIGIFVNLISTVILAAMFGYDMASEEAMVTEMLGTMNVANMGYDFTRMYKILIIISAGLTGVMEGFLTHIFSKFMLKRLKFKVEPPKSVLSYNIPKLPAYIAFIGYVASNVMFTRVTSTSMQDVLLVFNLLAAMFLMFCAYIGVLDYSHKKLKKPTFGVIIFILMFLFVPILVFCFGFIYITALKERWHNEQLDR